MSSEVPVGSSRGAETTTIDSAWSGLYRIGGAGALLVAVLVPVQITVFVVSPPPTTVMGWFTLFQDNSLLALLDMDLLLVVDQVLSGLVLLALYMVLRRTSQSLMVISLVAALLGIAAYISSNTAFNMLSLSNQYAAATTEAQRATFLAAGQAMTTIWTGTAFAVGYVLLGIGLLLTAVVMLRSRIFGRVTAIVGIILGVMSLIPASAGTIGMVFALGSLLPLELWYILTGVKLIRLGGRVTI